MRDAFLVSQDAPRAAGVALRDEEVARRLGTLESGFRARRELSVAVKLRAGDLHRDARSSLRFPAHLPAAMLVDRRYALRD